MLPDIREEVLRSALSALPLLQQNVNSVRLLLQQIDKEWLLTDLKHALEEDQVVFSYDEIHATMNSVLAFTSGDK